LDQLKGTFISDAKPRPLFRVDADFRFKDPNGLLWLTPAGTEVDGASIPQFLWSIIGGPFEGAYLNASVIHDHYCRTMERTAHDTHRDFYYGMRTSKVPEWKAEWMHWAVLTFGPSWQVVMEKAVPGLTQKPMPPSPIDLSDPEILAAAINKTHAVGRTLLTSDGKILDVTEAGQVDASVETVQRSADAYRQVFASKEFSSSPGRLGLLSQAITLADVPRWAGDRIPTLNEAIVLNPENDAKVKANTPFKLDPRSKGLIRRHVNPKVLSTIPKDN